jgi:WD40 repeat protein
LVQSSFVFSALSPDGRRVVGPWINTYKVWDETGKECLSLPGPGSISRFSPDGRFIAVAKLTGGATVWDGRTGDRVRDFQAPSGRWGQMGLAFSRDGRRLALGGMDGIARAWEVETGDELAVGRGHTLAEIGLAACTVGLLGSPGGAGPLLAASALFPGRDPTGAITALALSPDGRRLATVAGGISGVFGRIWDCETGQEVARFDVRKARINKLAFSPDGRRLAGAAMGTEDVRQWDATSGQELLPLRGHRRYTSDLAFTPDGRRLITVGADKTVRVWDPLTGNELLTLERHAAPVTAVVITSDGARVLTRDTGGTVLVWDSTPLARNPGDS